MDIEWRVRYIYRDPNGGGCDAGFGGLAALTLAIFAVVGSRRKK